MNICFIGVDYSTEKNHGGLATYLDDITDFLSEKGHKIYIICESEKNRKISHYKNENVHVYAINKELITKKYLENVHLLRNISKKMGILYLFEKWFSSIYVHKILKYLNKKVDIDLIEIADSSQIGFFTSLDKNLKKIVKYHMPEVLLWNLDEIFEDNKISKVFAFLGAFKLLKFISKRFEEIQMHQSKKIIAVSKSMKKVLVDLFKVKSNNIEVFYNHLNIRDVQEKGSRNRSPIFNKYILYFGRLERRKGVRTLADAIPQVLSKKEGLNFVFVGDEPHYDKGNKEYIMKKCKDFKKNLHFLERKDKTVLYPIVKNAEMVVLPSIWEPFGYTCLESMALGSLVLASGGSGYEEQIVEDGKYGFLFEPKRPHNLAKKILKVLEMGNNKKEIIKKRAKKRALKFDIRDNEDKILNHYKKLCDSA